MKKERKSISASKELWQNIEFVDGVIFSLLLLRVHGDKIEKAFVEHAVAIIKWNKYKPEAIRSHNRSKDNTPSLKKREKKTKKKQ